MVENNPGRCVEDQPITIDSPAGNGVVNSWHRYRDQDQPIGNTLRQGSNISERPTCLLCKDEKLICLVEMAGSAKRSARSRGDSQHVEGITDVKAAKIEIPTGVHFDITKSGTGWQGGARGRLKVVIKDAGIKYEP